MRTMPRCLGLNTVRRAVRLLTTCCDTTESGYRSGMQRPDTIIEIHRERVQDQTVEMFSGDKYTESVDGTGYSATATLDLTLDRVWFIFDARQRLWQEIVDNE